MYKVYIFTMVKMHALFRMLCAFNACVTTIGAAFFVRSFGCALFIFER